MKDGVERIAVIGSTGPTGIHLVRELVSRGRTVVAVSRRRDRMEDLFDSDRVEIRVADALDAGAVGAAVSGCTLVADCIGLPPERMADHPRTARIIVDAAAKADARCLQLSSYWSFFPQRLQVVNESHPRRGGHKWFRLRREAEEIMISAGAAVVHLPDFFGPHVHTSTVQLALQEAVAAKPVSWLGRTDIEREVGYVPDLMRIVADLAEHPDAYGTDWGLPGAGCLTGERCAQISAAKLGRPVGVRGSTRWLLRVLTLVHPQLRRIRPIVPEYLKPVRYDTSKLRNTIGDPSLTSLEAAIGETLAWLERR